MKWKYFLTENFAYQFIYKMLPLLVGNELRPLSSDIDIL